MKKSFTDIYLNLIKEDPDQENLELTDQETNLGDSENSDIEKNSEVNNEFEDEGWGASVEEKFHDILEQIEDLSYEIKNCQRGVYTKETTIEGLKLYVEELGKQLAETAREL